ncbi:membrane or secreted protein [Candidatus Omnitrophus magneticus]|uniref:Membrane or secreted protein n=1 Tax=Candidatus Omnitrophus magneticus TaxID=1609969 RepID=A0A0F0CPG1_9BACT|nr:membrane or secreted protein [Candidatus Omnitrophus magneticus]
MFKNNFKVIYVFLLLIFLMNVSDFSFAQKKSTIETLRAQGLFENMALNGIWVIDDRSIYPLLDESSGIKPPSIDQSYSRTYFIQSGLLPKKYTKMSYGAALNMKFFSGLSYDYLQKNLPGKTVSMDVFIPEESISSYAVVPNRLQVVIKSEKKNEWADYYGETEWIRAKTPGLYHVRIKIPEEPVMTKSGKLFYPDHAILVCIDYYLMEGAKRHSSITYSFSNFNIEGIKLDPKELKWQLTVDGYSVENMYLPYFGEDNTFISSIGTGVDVRFNQAPVEAQLSKPFSGKLENLFLALSVYIPVDLRQQKGTLALTIRDNKGAVRSSVENFHSADLAGRVHLTLPLDAFTVEKDINEIVKNTEITLRIKTLKPHESGMMPIVLSKLEISQGWLVPFDTKWQVRDIQGLGGYPKLEIREDGLLSPGSGISVRKLDGGNELRMTVKLKGGINWNEPYYRVEIIRPLENAPVNLNNMHLEALVSPFTDTTDIWQRPHRARVGLLDINGNIAFGPNVSLSEGMPNLATFEVSLTNPIPKGFVMTDFDPEKVQAIIINIEASAGKLEAMDLDISFTNLLVSPMEYPRTSPLKMIDYSRFEVKPELWEIKKVVEESGGYLVGINYPFPAINVPEFILAVPQVYPAVGQKPTDPGHFGLSAPITRAATLEAFRKFADIDVSVVRVFLFGHLGGIFDWDERGYDIKGFCEGNDALIQELAGMGIDKFTQYLKDHEDELFEQDADRAFKGVGKYVLKDMEAIYDVVEQVEKETGKRLLVILSCFDFLLGDGIKAEGPLHSFIVGEYPQAVTDPLVKVKVQALTWKLMKTLAQDERFYKYTGSMEVMNEPDNATGLATRKHFIDLLNFVGEGAYLFKDVFGPKIPVTVGFRSWHGDLRYWAPIAGGVDILMPHYWKSLESYCIDEPGLWPLEFPVDSLWKFLGANKEGKLSGLGEIAPDGDFVKNLYRLEKGGYNMTLVWSYSGHDGFDAKPVLQNIKEYQQANFKLREMQKMPFEQVREAFLYVAKSRAMFETIDITRSSNASSTSKFYYLEKDASFASFLSKKLNTITNEQLKYTVREILMIARMKAIALNYGNIQFLYKRAMKDRKDIPVLK